MTPEDRMDKLEEAIGQLAVSGRETAKRPEDRLERRLEHILEMILKELKELVLSDQSTRTRIDELRDLTQIISNIQMVEFRYTEGKITQCSDDFDYEVEAAYQAEEGEHRWCLLTNDILPKQTVNGAHLFKREWKEQAHVLGIDDIDDTRNGLPLWVPIEWAYDTSRLCFIYDKEDDNIVAHILDPGIRDVKLAKKGEELMGKAWKDPKPSLQSLTFQSLDGHSLQFAPDSLHRPFRRALNFQARQARRYAIQLGWKPASWDFEDFFTEGMDILEKLKLWGFGVA